MRNVEDDLIDRRVEDVVQRYRELDGRQVGGHVAALARAVGKNGFTQLGAQLDKLRIVQAVDVCG